MAATLTHAMLDDLHIGNACISLKAYTSGGVDITQAVSFAADQTVLFNSVILCIMSCVSVHTPLPFCNMLLPY